MKRKDAIEILLRNRMSYFEQKNSSDIIAVSSRVRLARNLAQYHFPVSASVHDMAAVRNIVEDAVNDSKVIGARGLMFYMDELSDIDREFLYERRLVSSKLISDPLNRGLFVSANEQLAIMVNEEDHLRIQSFLPGFQLKEAYKKASKCDDKLAEYLEFAFDDKLGYLTGCPTNIGTGLRASVMLHLPGLTLIGELESTLRALNKLNFAVRGIFGEGSENVGALYQISNQVTLGDSEEEIIDKISDTIERIISCEQQARERMFAKKQSRLLDFIGRSYGLLKYAYLLNSKETLNALSGVKLGVDMGIFANVNSEMVHRIYTCYGAAHLQKFNGGAFENNEAKSIFRADFVRKILRENMEKDA